LQDFSGKYLFGKKGRFSKEKAKADLAQNIVDTINFAEKRIGFAG